MSSTSANPLRPETENSSCATQLTWAPALDRAAHFNKVSARARVRLSIFPDLQVTLSDSRSRRVVARRIYLLGAVLHYIPSINC